MNANAAASLQKIISTLKAERDELDSTIRSLESAVGLEASHKADSNRSGSVRKRANWSPAAKKAAAERMRAYWAARRKSS